ncbi:MAG: hypothetical protein J5771_00945 [Bacteroidales bacterium]|nr:hypothetical protein [Bacteroidales bacterium]
MKKILSVLACLALAWAAANAQEEPFTYAEYLSVSVDDDFSLGEIAPSATFATFKDALAARPALPDPAKLVSHAGREAYAKTAKAYELALEALCERYAQEYMNAFNPMAAAPAPKPQGRPQGRMQGPPPGMPDPSMTPDISPQEIFAAMAKAGVDPTTATPEQMQSVILGLVAEKTGMDKSKLQAMMNAEAAAEDKPSRSEQIYEELQALFEQMNEESLKKNEARLNNLQASLLGGKVSDAGMSLEDALGVLAEKIAADWQKSDECKEINSMEKALAAKTENWMKANNKNWNDPLPSFWAEGRKDQNKVVDRYNKKSLVAWIAKIKEYDEPDLVYARKLAALDSELDAMPTAEKQSPSWKQAKSKAASMNGLLLHIVVAPQTALKCPLVGYVPTEYTF